MSSKPTPLMAQYHAIKEQYSHALLFFQVGDFYELFFDDAKQAAAFLGITLTKRGKDAGNDIPLCGVPVHTVQHYLAKLVKGGFSVAMCDQLEAPKPGTVVKRGVTRVLTPGTLTDSTLLDEKSASYIFAFVPGKDQWGLVFAELLTAQLYGTTCKPGQYKTLETELARFFPDEIILSDDVEGQRELQAFKKQGYFTSSVARADGTAWIDQQFEKKVIDGVNAQQALRQAFDLFYSYMHTYQAASLSTFQSIHVYEPDDFLLLDHSTQKNLELVANTYDGTRAHSLLEVLDRTCTAMGARTLKKWLVRPLLDVSMIRHRHDAVAFLQERYVLLSNFRTLMQQIGDIERIVGRIGLERATVSDYVHLKQVFEIFEKLIVCIPDASPLLVRYVKDACHGFFELHALLVRALNSDAMYDWTIAAGYDSELDQLRSLMLNSQQALLDLEQQEQRATGINSLKIRYNNLYGYYIEITKPNLHLVPDRYTQRHSLVGKDRFVSPELLDLERRITSVQADAQQKEQELFKSVMHHVRSYVGRLRKAATMIGHGDVLASFAYSAAQHGYIRPEMCTESQDVRIDQGRHPVVEQLVGSGFVPNNTQLTHEEPLWIITGPNMGGKSTYLRQVALMSVMAQCGSFVPARCAQLPLFDRIFTRIGAADNVAAGKSTFLMEMEETADICRYATEKSLVILDEVGRGTSTQDGVALAQAIVEYLYTSVKARCLFATHYHELTALQEQHAGIVCYYTASKQTDTGIVFLHTLLRGVSHQSFGLEVAKLAHLPPSVIVRAQELVVLGKEHAVGNFGDGVNVIPAQSLALLEALRSENEALKKKVQALEVLEQLDPLELTPKKAFDVIWQWKQRY